MLQRFTFTSLRRMTPSWLAATSTSATLPSCTISLLPSTTGITPQTATTTVSLRHRSSRSLRGLYDGKDVRFGNNVPFSLKKTRRRWNPNVQLKRVYSEILGEMIPFHITTSALRSIDKMGGLDNYLLGSRHVSTKGEGEGQRVRNRIIQKMKHQEHLKKEAIERGESVEDWDKIVLIGKKIKGSQPASAKSD
eukprot:g150.t1 g150   contig1:362585-363337(-)